jgi:hypothetical protein
MVSMKMTKKEKKEHHEGMVMASPDDGPSYPYGLRLRLDDDSLTKLGMSLPKVGSKVSVDAVGEVVEVSQHEDGKDKRRSVEIQIQKLSVGGKA